MNMFEHAMTRDQYYELQERIDLENSNQAETDARKPEIQSIESVIGDPNDTTFMEKGECKNLPPAYMFGQDAPEVEAAKQICNKCVVKIPCLEYALNKKINNGVWGGKSERERKAILKIQRLQRLANE